MSVSSIFIDMTAIWINHISELQRRFFDTMMRQHIDASTKMPTLCNAVSIGLCRECQYLISEIRNQAGYVSIRSFYQYGLTSMPAWASNHMPNKVWDEITNPLPTFNDVNVEVSEWISDSMEIF